MITPIVIALLFASLFMEAHAQEPVLENQAEPTQVQIQNPENAQQVRDMVRDRRATIAESVQNRIHNLAANITNRLTAALDRMSGIHARLETRIQKMNSQDFDTVAARMKLDEAEVAILEGRNMLADIGSIKDAIVSDRPRESYAAIRAELKAVRDQLGIIMNLLREATALLTTAPMRNIPTEITPTLDIN
jgi:hypothetical protein